MHVTCAAIVLHTVVQQSSVVRPQPSGAVTHHTAVAHHEGSLKVMRIAVVDLRPNCSRKMYDWLLPWQYFGQMPLRAPANQIVCCIVTGGQLRQSYIPLSQVSSLMTDR